MLVFSIQWTARISETETFSCNEKLNGFMCNIAKANLTTWRQRLLNYSHNKDEWLMSRRIWVWNVVNHLLPKIVAWWWWLSLVTYWLKHKKNVFIHSLTHSLCSEVNVSKPALPEWTEVFDSSFKSLAYQKITCIDICCWGLFCQIKTLSKCETTALNKAGTTYFWYLSLRVTGGFQRDISWK